MQAHPVIEVSNLSYNYGNIPVLKNLSFKIEKGQYVGLIGPNGSGKTTLLRLLLGLNKKQTGSIKIYSQEIEKFTNFSKIGYIPQQVSVLGQDFPATVQEVVESGIIKNEKLNTKNDLNRVFELTEISALKNKLISQLSGGQLQRVFIARSLVNNPEILIFDEPTVGVDSENQMNFYNFLQKANKEMGLTIIFVTHDIETISKEASRILCINKGVIDEKNEYLEEEESLLKKHLHSKIEHLHN